MVIILDISFRLSDVYGRLRDIQMHPLFPLFWLRYVENFALRSSLNS